MARKEIALAALSQTLWIEDCETVRQAEVFAILTCKSPTKKKSFWGPQMWDLSYPTISSDESATIEQYSDAEMVLGMEGNTNTSSLEESVKIWYLEKSQRTCWASYYGNRAGRIVQIEKKIRSFCNVDKVANLIEEAILDS